MSIECVCDRCGEEYDLRHGSCPACASRLRGWLYGARLKGGEWRKRARNTMRSVVTKYLDEQVSPDVVEHFEATDVVVDVDKLIALVDAAYPFGERAMHPYKAWLAERKILRDTLSPDRPERPTADDYAAVLVAIDLFETGESDAAQTLLDEQAPRRLNLSCPVCGAAIGSPCFDAESDTNQLTIAGRWLVEPTEKRTDRIVPHLSRVEPRSTP